MEDTSAICASHSQEDALVESLMRDSVSSDTPLDERERIIERIVAEDEAKRAAKNGTKARGLFR